MLSQSLGPAHIETQGRTTQHSAGQTQVRTAQGNIGGPHIERQVDSGQGGTGMRGTREKGEAGGRGDRGRDGDRRRQTQFLPLIS